MNKLVAPVINTLRTIQQNFVQTLNRFVQKCADIQDKLTAMFGEMKAAVEKKISETLASFKKKIISIWAVFEPKEVEDVDDEDKQIEEQKRIFEAKTFINDLYNKITGNLKKEENNDNSKN